MIEDPTTNSHRCKYFAFSTLNGLIISLIVITSLIIFSTTCYSQNDTVKLPAVQINGKDVYEHIKYLASDKLEGRQAGTEGDRLARNYLSKVLHNNGIRPLINGQYFQTFQFTPNLRQVYQFRNITDNTIIKTANIIGVIEGADSILKNEFILLGAHFDHMGRSYDDSLGKEVTYYGANDNASGTAGLLELSRKMNILRPYLRRSLIIAFFGGEEFGLNGSEFFSRSKLFSNYNIISMVNFDQIGRMTNDTLTLISYNMPKNIFADIESFNQNYGFIVNYFYDQHEYGDTYPFSKINIPVIEFHADDYKVYHTPEDLPEGLNINDEVRILNLAFDVIYTMNVSDDPFSNLTDNKYDKDSIFFSRKDIIRSINEWKTTLGCNFDLKSSKKGLVISRLETNGPAHRFRLQVGDIIIKLGDYDINDIADFEPAIMKYRPGQKIPIEYIRLGIVKKLSLTLGGTQKND